MGRGKYGGDAGWDACFLGESWRHGENRVMTPPRSSAMVAPVVHAAALIQSWIPSCRASRSRGATRPGRPPRRTAENCASIAKECGRVILDFLTSPSPSSCRPHSLTPPPLPPPQPHPPSPYHIHPPNPLPSNPLPPHPCLTLPIPSHQPSTKYYPPFLLRAPAPTPIRNSSSLSFSSHTPHGRHP